MKKITFILLGLLSSVSLMAQNAAPKSYWDDPFNNPMTPLYIVTAFVFIVLLLSVVVAGYALKVLNVLLHQIEKEKASKLGAAYVVQQSWWSKFLEKFNASVPLSQEKDIDLGHSYDGIRELDNHLPPWWKWLFYSTIGWAAVYLIVFHLAGSLPLSEQEYQNDVAQAEEQIQKLKAAQPQEAIDENALQYNNDATILAKGKSIFMANNCGSCHRNDGGGNAIGPNLTDEYWLHGGSIKDIYSTIKNGVIEKGMPVWGKAMSPKDVRDVSFFVMSLQGTKPANAKAPQGDLFKPATTTKTDSTKAQASL